MYLAHCAVLLRIEVMHLLMTACGIAFHSSAAILRNSRKGVLGLTRSAFFFLMRAKTFSIGLISGLFAGQFIRSMLSVFKKSSTTPARPVLPSVIVNQNEIRAYGPIMWNNVWSQNILLSRAACVFIHRSLCVVVDLGRPFRGRFLTSSVFFFQIWL